MTEAPPREDKGVILLVDDEPDIRSVLGLVLSASGYEVLIAPHAAMALDLIEERRPDLVVTDFMMPWMNGRELVVRLKRRLPDTPTVLMSGVNPGDPQPWDAFLQKPMEIQALLETVERLLPGRRRAG